MKNITQVSPDDDFHKIINLIYHTDKYIYPSMCGFDYDYFVKIMMYNLGTNSIFSYQNIIKAKINDDIVGILLSFTKDQLLPILPKNNEIEIRNCYEKVMIEYFQKSLENIKDNSLYINNLCVNNQYQNSGIGYALIQYILSNTEYKIITLDCIENNLPAIKLYKKCGFTITDRFLGYSGVENKQFYCLNFEKYLE